MAPSETIERLAAGCAGRLPPAPHSFAADREQFAREIDALLDTVRGSDASFAYDAGGRPGAVAAVRNALPAAEADLLQAILEDVSCELAAWQEALYRVALACRRTGP